MGRAVFVIKVDVDANSPCAVQHLWAVELHHSVAKTLVRPREILIIIYWF